jgi:GNAT superfamily N-acetyltransferase
MKLEQETFSGLDGKKKWHAMVEEFGCELDAFLRERFNYRNGLVTPVFCTLDVDRVRVRTYLRFYYMPQGEDGFWPQDSLVIARLGFEKHRAGHGRALLQFVIDRAAKYGYTSIGVESTINAEGIQGFCRHFFEPYRTDPARGHITHWLAPASKIAEQLVADRAALAVE